MGASQSRSQRDRVPADASRQEQQSRAEAYPSRVSGRRARNASDASTSSSVAAPDAAAAPGVRHRPRFNLRRRLSLGRSVGVGRERPAPQAMDEEAIRVSPAPVAQPPQPVAQPPSMPNAPHAVPTHGPAPAIDTSALQGTRIPPALGTGPRAVPSAEPLFSASQAAAQRAGPPTAAEPAEPMAAEPALPMAAEPAPRAAPAAGEPAPDAPQTAGSAPAPQTAGSAPADPLAAERRATTELLERVLGRPLTEARDQPDRGVGTSAAGAAHAQGAPRPSSAPPSPSHARLDPASLPGSRPPLSRMSARHQHAGGGRPTSALATLLSELLGGARPSPPDAPPATQLSGTSVIVQGALVARTAPSTPRGEPAPRPPPPSEPGTPQAATIEEQGEMLGRILRVATAATAASLVNNRGAPGAEPAQPAPAPPRRSSGLGGLGSELFERLSALSGRVRSNENAPEPPRPPPAEPAEPENMSMISRLMREALRTSSPSPGPPAGEAQGEPSASGPSTPASIMLTLENARQGRPLGEGAPGSFDRFLHDLITDLSAAVQRVQREREAPAQAAAEAEAEAPDVRERRQSDLSSGQLSFFRLYRFERSSDSALTPCVMVGVRSLRADERLMAGEEETEPPAQPAAGAAAEGASSGAEDAAGGAAEGAAPEGRPGPPPRPQTSRFVLFVSGGRYHEQHPLLTSHPRDAGRDLMFMMELLGSMAAMSNKRPTASASDIARSGLRVVKASEIAALRARDEVTENTSEKCLVCLEPWQPEDECRLLRCRHVFHSHCVDKWLSESSNSCPLCRSVAANVG